MDTAEKLEALAGVPVLEAYGMTEASHQMSSNPLPPKARKPGTVGMATGIRIGTMDDSGDLLPAGGKGEVVMQGPSVIQAYENNPEANAKSFTNGWFRTGDEGLLDDEGYLRLTGRIKELINRGGEKIAPREIDEVLLTHPGGRGGGLLRYPAPNVGRRSGRGGGAARARDRSRADRPLPRAPCRLQMPQEAFPGQIHPAHSDR